ncbi:MULTISPECIES: hypothetical protein [unclassified Streptomyces]|uniref:hypothetical protein n=1 Tax=unclassified Streptomyces TaxID=2593676 RepID=UPI0003654EF7|nr:MULTISPECIES: hypothetical protein [unclassified Streptomyces]MYT30128.1 hypothetical protein [Streptomyces sp. SID8354]
MTLGWLGTGSLFAWSAWKLALTLYLEMARPNDVCLPENLALAVVLHSTAVSVGALMLSALVRAHRHRHRTPPVVADIAR